MQLPVWRFAVARELLCSYHFVSGSLDIYCSC